MKKTVRASHALERQQGRERRAVEISGLRPERALVKMERGILGGARAAQA
jgi:hypothetical protein